MSTNRGLTNVSPPVKKIQGHDYVFPQIVREGTLDINQVMNFSHPGHEPSREKGFVEFVGRERFMKSVLDVLGKEGEYLNHLNHHDLTNICDGITPISLVFKQRLHSSKYYGIAGAIMLPTGMVLPYLTAKDGVLSVGLSSVENIPENNDIIGRVTKRDPETIPEPAPAPAPAEVLEEPVPEPRRKTGAKTKTRKKAA